MKKLFVILAIVLICIGMPLFAGGSGEKTSGGNRIAVMYGVGGLGDQSFNDNINNAIIAAQETLDFEYDYVEPTAVSEFETFLREFALSGDYTLIISAGSDSADALNKVAGEFPEQYFVLLDSASAQDNVISVTFKDNESTFLAGYVAALSSETGCIGVIGAMDIDVINGFIAGWEAGARYADPDIEILRMYCGGFQDPVTAKEMALQMYARGADIIMGAAGGSGLGIFQAAEETGNYAVGVDSNQNPLKPATIMMSAVRNFKPVIYSILSDSFDGNVETGLRNVGIAEGAVECTFDGSEVHVDQSIKDALMTIEGEVREGKISVPSAL